MTSVPYCPINFELVKSNDGGSTYVALTSAEANSVSLINPMQITVRNPCPNAPNSHLSTQWCTWQQQFPWAANPTKFTLSKTTNGGVSTSTTYPDNTINFSWRRKYDSTNSWYYYMPQVFLQIMTQDMTLDGQTWNLAVNRQSTRST